MWHRAGARKQQLEVHEESGSGTTASPITATAVADQRKALKFGFSSKSSTSKVCDYRITLCVLEWY